MTLPRRGSDQPWFCDCCGVEGTVPKHPGSSMDALAELIRDAHALIASGCVTQNKGGLLRAGLKPANWAPAAK